MSRELYNNLIVIINLVLMVAFIGLSIHAFHSHSDIIEGTLFLLAGFAQATNLGISIYKLFKDRLED